MRLIPPVLILALAGCGLAVGSGNVTSTTRDVSPFSRIAVASGITVNAVPGTKEVIVRTDDNLQSKIATVVEGDTLAIRLVDPWVAIGSHTALEVNVTNEALEGIDASGGSRAFITATAATSFRAVASGGSPVEVEDLAVTDFSVDASGGSAISLAGAASKGVAVASGGSDLKLADVPLETLRLDASGGSTVKARVSQTLTGSATGGSIVTITGTPASTLDTSGGSQVHTSPQ